MLSGSDTSDVVGASDGEVRSPVDLSDNTTAEWAGCADPCAVLFGLGLFARLEKEEEGEASRLGDDFFLDMREKREKRAFAPMTVPTVRSDEAAAHGKLMTGIGDCQNLYDSFLRGARTRPASPCFGSRVRDDGSVGDYEWQTYQQVKARVEAFAAEVR